MKKHKIIFRILLIVISSHVFYGYRICTEAVAEVPVEDPVADLEAVRAVDRIVIITGKAEDVEDRLK
ncbi:MAG: hypothetical protein ACLU80_10455 [Dorea sp.]